MSNQFRLLSGFRELCPESVSFADAAPLFVPATELGVLVQKSLLAPESEFYNVEHDHLNSARIGFLWTNVESIRKGKLLLGTAEVTGGVATGWAKARALQQQAEWFGEEPLDFLITLYAPFFANAQLPYCLSVLEHELYHCGHQNDLQGVPKFKPDGTPVFYIKGHDIEEFMGVARRYGATTPELAILKDILTAWTPEFDATHLEKFCGTCR